MCHNHILKILGLQKLDKNRKYQASPIFGEEKCTPEKILATPTLYVVVATNNSTILPF